MTDTAALRALIAADAFVEAAWADHCVSAIGWHDADRCPVCLAKDKYDAARAMLQPRSKGEEQQA